MNIDALLEQTQWDTFWVPTDVVVVDRPELMYMSAPRDDRVANRVLRLRAPDEALPRLIEEVCEAHAGKTSVWCLTPQCRRESLERALSEAGYAPKDEHFAYSLDVGAHRGKVRDGITARPVSDHQSLLDCIAVLKSAFESTQPLPPAERLAVELDECTRPGKRVHRVVAYDAHTGEPLSSGGLTAFPALGLGLLWAGGTVESGRGRGAYRAVLDGRIRWARAQGLSHVALYARVQTSAPIVAKLGFTRAGRMSFWERPGR